MPTLHCDSLLHHKHNILLHITDHNQNQPIVFLLWGKQAEKKKELLTNPNHLVLVTSHPSPFSARRGFFGSNHFKLANEFLKEKGLDEINWKL